MQKDEHKSPLPLTDPRDAVPCAHRAVHMSTVSVINSDRWRSPVYHTDRPPPKWQQLRWSAVPEIWWVPTKI